LFVAELVTEHACQEIARRKKDANILDIPPGVEILDAYNATSHEVEGGLRPRSLHKALVHRENRRK